MSSANPHHRLAINRLLGTGRLQLDVELNAPWTMLFGPSGAGKSTILRAVAGLLRGPGIWLERRQQTLQNARICKPPEAREVGFAPQHPWLFPHLTVLQNIEFSSRATGSRSTDTNNAQSTLVANAITLFGLETLIRRRPPELSGGEAQRVNLARAFAVPNCKLMLLDEPFAGTDRALRDELLPRMRASLRERDIPVLSVSHDVDEALLLEAEVIHIEAGRVIAQGPPHEVLAAERTRMVTTLTQNAFPPALPLSS